MKYYQYITKDKVNPEEEFWVCENCRKRNSSLILEGKWRLIGRQENGDRACNECLNSEQQSAQQQGNTPSPDTSNSAPKAPGIKN